MGFHGHLNPMINISLTAPVVLAFMLDHDQSDPVSPAVLVIRVFYVFSQL